MGDEDHSFLFATLHEDKMTTQKSLLERVSTMARAVVDDPDNMLARYVGHGRQLALHGRIIGLDAEGKPKIAPVTVLLAMNTVSLTELVAHVKLAVTLRCESRQSLVAQLDADDALEGVALSVLQAALRLGDVLDGEPLLLVQGFQDQYLLMANVAHGPDENYWQTLMRSLLDTLGCRKRRFDKALWHIATRQADRAEAA